MSATVNVNGRITDEHNAQISVFDHGFLYGEGVYETLRTYHDRLFLFPAHAARLRRSASLIALALPFDDDALRAHIQDTLREATLDGADAYVRVIVTRGIGAISYDPRATPSPSFVIIVTRLTDTPRTVYDDGVEVAIVSVVRNHPGTVDPAIKSNNLLNSALAMQEALRLGAFEGVMRNYRGELSEGTISNLFVVTEGAIRTPPLTAGILAGITRAFVLDLAGRLGLVAREDTLVDADLLAADEAFLTSTTREIVPIATVGGHPVGSGRPGAITRRLMDAFRRETR